MKRTTPVLATLALMLSGVGQARAGILYYTVFKNILFEQTTNTKPTTPTNFFVNGGVISSSANDLTGGTVITPHGSYSLTVADPLDLQWDAGLFPSLGAMNTAFPAASTYQFTVNSRSLGTRSDTLVTPSVSLFTANVPYVTDFTGLDGMYTAKPFTVTFPSTTTVSGSNDSHIYFTIFNAFNTDALANSTTSYTIAANMLKPNTTYTFELDYSNRLDTPATGGFSGATGQAGFDVRTDGTFTTGPAVATPEPATFTLVAIGIAGMAGYCWRRRKHAA